MATYTPVSRSIPSAERVIEITAVAVGDRIDLVDALGRPARGLQMTTSSATDQVDYTLNSLRRVVPRGSSSRTAAEKLFGVYESAQVDIWQSSGDSFSSVGEVLETVSGLTVSSIQIDALTLGTGTTITIVAW